MTNSFPISNDGMLISNIINNVNLHSQVGVGLGVKLGLKIMAILNESPKRTIVLQVYIAQVFPVAVLHDAFQFGDKYVSVISFLALL